MLTQGKNSTRPYAPGIYGPSRKNVPVVAERSTLVSRQQRRASRPAPKTETHDGYEVDIPPSLSQHLVTKSTEQLPVPYIPAREYEEEDDQAQAPRRTRRLPAQRQQKHWVFYLGVFLFCAVILWWLAVCAANLLLDGYNTHFYGSSRTHHVEAVLHLNHDSAAHQTSLEAVNRGGQIELWIIPAGDPKKATIIEGPDLAKLIDWKSGDPAKADISIEISDLNHDGKPDVTVIVQSNEFNGVFQRQTTRWHLLNTGDSLKPSSGM